MSKYLIEPTGIIYRLYLRVKTLHPDSKLIYSNFRDNLTSYWEKAMAPHSSTLAWKIPWTEEPGRLQSMGLLRVGHH